MLRYHKKVYFPICNIPKLKDFTISLNNLSWEYTKHTLDNIKDRFLDIKGILLYIKDITLSTENIFEYYMEAQKIVKVCYRIKYNNGMDIILVLSEYKNIVTIYINSTEDKHITLKTELYQKE